MSAPASSGIHSGTSRTPAAAASAEAGSEQGLAEVQPADDHARCAARGDDGDRVAQERELLVERADDGRGRRIGGVIHVPTVPTAPKRGRGPDGLRALRSV